MADVRRDRDGKPIEQLSIECHVVGDARPGFWCPVCNLPSAVEVDFALVDAATLASFGRGVARRCYDCGNPVPFVGDDPAG